jgi:CRP-like cAMP-binding protein
VELVTLLITKGSYFAEYSLLLSIPKHSSSVRAVTPTELLSLGKEEFEFVGSFFPQIFEKVSWQAHWCLCCP